MFYALKKVERGKAPLEIIAVGRIRGETWNARECVEVARTTAESVNSWVVFTEEDGVCDPIPSHETCL